MPTEYQSGRPGHLEEHYKLYPAQKDPPRSEECCADLPRPDSLISASFNYCKKCCVGPEDYRTQNSDTGCKTATSQVNRVSIIALLALLSLEYVCN